MTNEIQQLQQSSTKAKFVSFRPVYPFIKWAGGKRQLLSVLGKMVPRQFNSYHEPFLGGGAMFFHLVSKNMVSVSISTACLSDANVVLITTWLAIKDNVKGVIELLEKYEYEYKRYPPYSKEQQDYYKQVKNAWNNRIRQSGSDVEKAATFIFLNKTCVNGLYRVSRKTGFNVPPGRFKENPNIYDDSNLKNVSSVLKSGVSILACDYKDALKNAQRRDFVYLDPPYDPKSATANFTSYTLKGFGRKDQEQLALVFRELDSRGCLLLLSNSDTPFVRALYSGFTIREVKAQRAINCKASKRAGHKELLISNYS